MKTSWLILTAAAMCLSVPTSAAPHVDAAAVLAQCHSLAGGENLTKEDAEVAVAACTQSLASQEGDLRLHYLKGRALFALERDEEALAAYAVAAAGGWAPAIHQLGVMHHWGYGVPEDPAKALGLYRRALEAGDISAAIPLARLLREGGGVMKDPVESTGLYRRAAEAGLSDGEFGLGYAYETGVGVERNLSRAAELYRSAAEKGSADAQHNLGVMAAQGRGMPVDFSEAARLFKLSAEGGSPDGMFAWGLAHATGRGVSKDFSEAERWYRKAIEAGNEVNASNSLAYLYALENRNLDQAAALAEGALEADPENAAVLDTLGLIRFRQNRLPEAAELLRRSVALEPTPLHHSRLGDIYAAMGLQEEARLAWRLALTAPTKPGDDAEVAADELRRKLATEATPLRDASSSRR